MMTDCLNVIKKIFLAVNSNLYFRITYCNTTMYNDSNRPQILLSCVECLDSCGVAAECSAVWDQLLYQSLAVLANTNHATEQD